MLNKKMALVNKLNYMCVNFDIFFRQLKKNNLLTKDFFFINLKSGKLYR